MLSRRKRWKPIVSVRGKVEVRDLSFTSLSRGLNESNVNKAILKTVLEEAQDELIDELCGGK